MSGYSYLRRWAREYVHLVGDDGLLALCGQVRRGVDGWQGWHSSGEPAEDGMMCPVCLSRYRPVMTMDEALAIVQEVARLAFYCERCKREGVLAVVDGNGRCPRCFECGANG